MSDSPTSLVLPLQSEVQTEPRHGGERDCFRLRTPVTSITRLVVGVSPNSFSTMALNTSLVVKVGYQRRQRTRRSLVFSPNGSFTQACVFVLHVMRHNTNSRTVIQITKKCTTLALQCVYSHTCGTRTVIAHCLIGTKFSGWAKQRKER